MHKIAHKFPHFGPVMPAGSPQELPKSDYSVYYCISDCHDHFCLNSWNTIFMAALALELGTGLFLWTPIAQLVLHASSNKFFFTIFLFGQTDYQIF